jgi:type II secretory pathway component GspD/PulD (secretin)
LAAVAALVLVPHAGASPPSNEAVPEWKTRLDLQPDEIEANVVRILRTTNKAQINRYAAKVYDFRKVNPGAINNYFHSALFREEGAAYTFVGPDGTSGKLLVICPQYQIPYFDELAAALDREKLTSAPGSSYNYKQLRHRSAADTEFLTIVRQYASDNSVVIGDIETNAMFYFDSPSGAAYLDRYLESVLDTPTPVIETHVRLYEVDLTNDGTLGFAYEDWRNGPGQNMLVGVLNRTDTAARSTGASGTSNTGTFNTYALVDLQYPSAYFDFLVQKGTARIVTDTHLVTSSSREATLFTGDQILYYRRTADDFDPNLRRTTSGEAERARLPATAGTPGRHNASGVLVEAEDAGIRLNLTPLASREKIQLDVEIAVISLTGFTEYRANGGGEPILSARRARTSISVLPDKEVVLGGMVRERQASTTTRVPILGKLPVLGWLFGGEKQVVRKSMLVAVLESRINNNYSNATDAQRAVMATVSGTVEPVLPAAAYGFDMMLLDSE